MLHRPWSGLARAAPDELRCPAPASLFTVRSLVAGAIAALLAALDVFTTVVRDGGSGFANDFYIYWASAHVLVAGGNPYDVGAVNQTLHALHLQVTVGQDGYSYPLLFAVLLIPLLAVPPPLAALVFFALSFSALALAVGLLLAPLSRYRLWELLLLAVIAGGFVPVRGSLFFGQANLLVLLPLAFAFRGVAAAVCLPLAACVKLYPAAGLGLSLSRGRRGVPQLLVGAALTLVLVLVPNVLLGRQHSAGHLAQMLGPDTFWSNESLNGAVSRLALPSDHTTPLLPGLPVVPVVLGVTLLTAAVVVLLIWRARGRPWDGCLTLVLGWALLAAPKVSLWDLAPLVLAGAFCWPHVRRRPLRLLVVAAGWTLIAAQSTVDLHRQEIYQGSPWRGLLSSLGVLGTLLVVGMVGYLVHTERPAGRYRVAQT
ncbi:MAG: DUF2029 domain-containing protein [Candidatus Dormibacteraeota bacterium]|nr:DUF2029 domain-containing protein [Candidatus Dormibacteraeota bacterium]MBO0704963.1 DUF2029 domain-containing protein [Candidatus Dormibacteraeota bacterium]MBO0761333.1 DUF2029 domain-containing protein [Candidatus Dormibacteraeota bacterium]